MCLFPHFAVRLRPGTAVAGARESILAVVAHAALELREPAWMDGPTRQRRPDVGVFFEPCTILGSFRVSMCGCSFGIEGGHARVQRVASALLGAREVLDVRYAFVWTGSGETEPIDQPVGAPLVERRSREVIARFVRPDDFDYATLRSLASVARALAPTAVASTHGKNVRPKPR